MNRPHISLPRILALVGVIVAVPGTGSDTVPEAYAAGVGGSSAVRPVGFGRSGSAAKGRSLAAVQVEYRNADDGTLLGGWLTLPEGEGPHPGVVVLSVAGTGALTERLVADGYAVLAPVRRGFVEVEPLLRATFDVLAGDVDAAVRYLGGRDDVDARRISLVAQADDTPPAILYAASAEVGTPLVLIAPPASPGTEVFRAEQRALGERDGLPSDELETLDAYAERIAEIVLSEPAAYVREYRLKRLRAGSEVELPRSAAYPAGEGQMHFFASPLWRDRLAFDPSETLTNVSVPVLVLVGEDDPGERLEGYLDAIGVALSGSSSEDVTVCPVAGRTRHAFTATGVEAIARWIGPRSDGGTGAVPAQAAIPAGELGCLGP